MLVGEQRDFVGHELLQQNKKKTAMFDCLFS